MKKNSEVTVKEHVGSSGQATGRRNHHPPLRPLPGGRERRSGLKNSPDHLTACAGSLAQALFIGAGRTGHGDGRLARKDSEGCAYSAWSLDLRLALELALSPAPRLRVS